jgi:hypothetical protein
MASPAKTARLKNATKGFTEVVSRGNNFIATLHASPDHLDQLALQLIRVVCGTDFCPCHFSAI